MRYYPQRLAVRLFAHTVPSCGPIVSTGGQTCAGKVCCNSHRKLPKPHTPGEPSGRVWRVMYRGLACVPLPHQLLS